MTTAAQSALLEMRHIHKSFFGVKVLDDVTLSLHAGEVLALLGENGAGKSTLIKILNADYEMDGGEILLNGKPVSFSEPRDADAAGIRMIYQELHYAPDLSVMENLLIGKLPKGKGFPGSYVIDWRRARKIAAESLALLEVNIDPAARMRDLPVVERQIVEIARAVSADARILVMDEPTAALTPHEVDVLFDLIKNLRRRGVAVIYISHRLDEIFRIADRVCVLRNGRHVATRPVSEVTPKALVEMMIGRELEERLTVAASSPEAAGGAVLEVKGLGKRGAFENVSFRVREGEIVGIFGLLGSGQIELTRAIFGADKADSGTVWIQGRAVRTTSPREAKRWGVGFVPEDRKVRGLVLGMSVRKNVTLSNWAGVSAAGFFLEGKERAHVRHWIEQLGLRMAGGMDTPVRYLSGGNQQKVVLSRWLEANVKVLLMNEPTWGVDVGARSDIYLQLEALAAKGLGVLIVSSDLQEILAVSHRILTIYKGRLTGEFRGSEATEEALLSAAAGGAA